MPPTSTRQDIGKNGEDAVLLLYKATQGESIIGLRKRLFFEKLDKANCFVKPERLPLLVPLFDTTVFVRIIRF